METIELTKRQFDNLKLFKLGKDITSTECNLFVIPTKNKWVTEEKLLKQLHHQEGRPFGNKLYVINTLMDEKENIGIDELVIPEKLAIVKNKVVGFTLPHVYSTNLYHILKNYDIPNEKKIKYLKEVGQILQKMKLFRKFNDDKFFLGDLHEQNFIVDDKTDKVNVVDLDSCTIGNAMPSPAKYLSTNNAIRTLPTKYPKIDTNYINSENTDFLCYNLIVLNYIAKTETHKLNLEEYYTYLDYLNGLKYDHKLLDCFAKVYTPAKNQNPESLLDKIPENVIPANYNVFKAKIKKL